MSVFTNESRDRFMIQMKNNGFYERFIDLSLGPLYPAITTLYVYPILYSSIFRVSREILMPMRMIC